MAAYNKNLVNVDKINAGKHCNYKRQHINNARLSLCPKQQYRNIQHEQNIKEHTDINKQKKDRKSKNRNGKIVKQQQ